MIQDPNYAAKQARQSFYGRILTMLAPRTRDIATLANALPDAWLMRTAKNKLADHQRRATRFDVTDEVPEMASPVDDPSDVPDDRLKLMFVCAHPAIDAGLHTPLMLQTVLELEAADIGRAFLVSPMAMAQRLVRAKRKIKDTRFPFRLPETADFAPRLRAVLGAIYGACALGCMVADDDLGQEALYLAQFTCQHMPEEAEAFGLAAVFGFIQSCAGARLQNGAFVPLPEQDVAASDRELVDQATTLLAHAKGLNCIRRFQIEAAIQSDHAHRAVTGDTDWPAIVQLYEGLKALHPAVGAAINPAEGLALLSLIEPAALFAFQPVHATHAHLLSGTDPQGAAAAYDHAISLTLEGPVRRYLEERRTSEARL